MFMIIFTFNCLFSKIIKITSKQNRMKNRNADNVTPRVSYSIPELPLPVNCLLRSVML